MAVRHPEIRAEWDAFEGAGGRLPLIEDVLAEDQGNEGRWRAGLLWSRGRPVWPLAGEFPRTIGALRDVPGLRSALWSLLEPGAALPAHRGPNAGVLRYHLGVVCNGESALVVDDVVTTYREGEGIFFDDTAVHAAWNRGSDPRVTLFCEVLRPLERWSSAANRCVHHALSLDERYRKAPSRAAEWHRALNPHLAARGR